MDEKFGRKHENLGAIKVPRKPLDLSGLRDRAEFENI